MTTFHAPYLSICACMCALFTNECVGTIEHRDWRPLVSFAAHDPAKGGVASMALHPSQKVNIHQVYCSVPLTEMGANR